MSKQLHGRMAAALLKNAWLLVIGSVAALCLSALLPLVASAATLDPPSPVPHAICTGATIPQGWVIMDHQTDWSQCSGGLFNPDNIEITAPAQASRTAVCLDSPVPQEWVILSENTDLTRCTVGFPFALPPLWNEKTIARATEASMQVCVHTIIPPDWAITGEALADLGAAAACPLDFAFTPGKSQVTISPITGNAMTICASSPLPAGYMVQSASYKVDCKTDGGSANLIVPGAQDGAPELQN